MADTAEPRPCAVCSAPFIHHDLRRKFCSDECAATAYKRRRKLDARRRQPVVICPLCRAEFCRLVNTRSSFCTPEHAHAHRLALRRASPTEAARNRSRDTRERSRRWRQTPSGRLAQRKRDALKRQRSAAGDLTPEEWAAILDRYDHRCYVCSGPAEEMEHVVPLSAGGLHTATNVRPVCSECNHGVGGKHTRPFFEWLPERLAVLAGARGVGPSPLAALEV